MGQDVANGGFVLHGHATSPLTGDIEFFAHWGDEGVDNLSAITAAQRDDLKDDAGVSQAAFDSTAGSAVSWYGFTGLTGTPGGQTAAEKRTDLRAACRKGVSLMG